MAKIHKKAKRMGSRPKYLRIVVYGDPGSQKTLRFPGTSPNSLLLNADGADGPEPIRDFYKGRIWDVHDYDDLDQALSYLRRTDHPFEWVWLDSGTLYQELGMDQIMDKLLVKKPHRDPDIPDMPQYLKNQNQFGRWIRHMKALPFNFGITAHIMRVEDQEDGEVTYMPALQGGGKIPLTTKVCGYMSVVGRLYIVTKEKGGKQVEVPVLQTGRRGKWYAKDRFGKLVDNKGRRQVINPTIPKLTKLIYG